MTTDAKEAAFSPFGGHKGYGLAVVAEFLSSLLSAGSYVVEEIEHVCKDLNMPTCNYSFLRENPIY